MAFPFLRQLNAMDCGPTCLRMIAKYYGRSYNSDTLRSKMGASKGGVSMFGISETAEKIGFRTRGIQIDYNALRDIPTPCILHWNQSHFVVLVKARKNSITVADPGSEVLTYGKHEFLQHWESTVSKSGKNIGSALLLEPSPSFYEYEGEAPNKLNWSIISKYLGTSRGQIARIVLSLVLGLVLQLILPFLTQTLVDTGINTRNVRYITIILSAQLMLIFSGAVIGFIRNRLQLRVANKISISILSDFWIKLTRLPLSYFDTHQIGDTLQRIGDNRQIQTFLTSQAITSLFSFVTLVVYSFLLITYSFSLFAVFSIGAVLYFGWIKLFFRIRRKLNTRSFFLMSKENDATLQLVQGMQDIRLNGAERAKRWEWENIQVKVFKLNFSSLTYSQCQSAGAILINQGKDVIITFLVAQLVIEGKLTFGAMLAIQYIIGQLSGPIQDLTTLAQSTQDAKISLERLNEVHEMKDEEAPHMSASIPHDKSITINNLSFAYPGSDNRMVLENINLYIPEGKVTAIVGMSGSGKTTLLKLLLRIYDQYTGELKVGNTEIRSLNPVVWRQHCGSVLQDGYIFNDTIARNIALGEDYIDRDRLVSSCKTANILTFIDSLPNGLNTVIGLNGVGLSQGQRQRLLITRAIYRQPDYLFFDEATNALDANNEKYIIENLQKIFKGRTVVVVAHRLSTVINADNIVVLDDGKLMEEGSHHQLVSGKGKYFDLVKNQLALGV